jgi:protein gp37
MGKTTIEWCTHVWNPVTGCTKVSPGCKNCYAERLSKRFGKDFSKVELQPDRLDQPLHWRKPRRIFVNSMSDLFHEAVPEEFIDRVFGVMSLADRHTFQILTKRPERMRDWMSPDRLVEVNRHHEETVLRSGKRQEIWDLNRRKDAWSPSVRNWPLPNVWLGVSVEDQKSADERIPLLLETPAAVRFVSYEPALGSVDFAEWLAASTPLRSGLGWIIAGGESGPNARPSHPDWFRSVRDQCVAAGVPYFFKRWGEWTSQSVDGRADLESTHVICPCGQYFAKGESAITREHVGSATHPKGGWYAIRRVGKKAAGRLLDGREWDEYPNR